MTKTYAANHNGRTFTLPRTDKCRVVYERSGVNYGKIIPTPVSNDALQVAMLQHGIALRQIQRVEPVR